MAYVVLKTVMGTPSDQLKFLKVEIYINITEGLYLLLGEFSVPDN